MLLQGTVVKAVDGYVAVEDVTCGTVIVTPSGPATVRQVWTGIQPMLRYTDSCGSLYCSGDQPILIGSRWIQADDIGTWVGPDATEQNAEEADMYGFVLCGTDKRVELQTGAIVYCGG